ncbi:MAG: hypothetical protein ACXVAT_09120 [Isosphaeraceae bacterium]|jgi:hypothetical protein
MFIRRVNGRAYIAESVRVGGRPTQRHYGPAIPGMLEMLQADQDKIRQEQREQQKLRDEEHEKDRQKDHLIADHHQMVEQEFEATMKARGYHNQNGRGWKKRRVPKSDRQRSEGGADA